MILMCQAIILGKHASKQTSSHKRPFTFVSFFLPSFLGFLGQILSRTFFLGWWGIYRQCLDETIYLLYENFIYLFIFFKWVIIQNFA